jgi:hypothetical protein
MGGAQMPGPVPQETKRRRNKPTIDPTTVPPGAYSGETPELPNAEKYSERTLVWYQTWRECEQAETFTKTAWLSLHMLADLVEEYYKKPTANTWAQIKQTQTGLLALPADQRRVGFKVKDPKKETTTKTSGAGSNVVGINDRRERLLADGA